jgi:major membrane immunogen (membrane-anchored lipoprotein)
MKLILTAACAALLLSACSTKDVKTVPPSTICDDRGCTTTLGVYTPYAKMTRTYQIEK